MLLGIVLKRNVDILYVFSFWFTKKLLKFQFIILKTYLLINFITFF